MKKLIAVALIIVITITLSAVAFASNREKNANPSQTNFVMDGKAVSFDNAYLIDDSNYLQLRSVAELLSGTKSQFNVYWDSELQQAVIETGKPYTGVAPTQEVAPIEKPIPTEEISPPVVSQSYKIGDTITLKNATIRLTEVVSANSTPPDEYGSRLLAGSGRTLLCISFEVTANSLNYNNTLWYPNNFIKYATSVSEINYEMPFSQGTVGFGANEKKSVTAFIEVPADETIISIVVSDGANETAIVSVQ